LLFFFAVLLPFVVNKDYQRRQVLPESQGGGADLGFLSP